jgi:hypothetical protein
MRSLVPTFVFHFSNGSPTQCSHINRRRSFRSVYTAPGPAATELRRVSTMEDEMELLMLPPKRELSRLASAC